MKQLKRKKQIKKFKTSKKEKIFLDNLTSQNKPASV